MQKPNKKKLTVKAQNKVHKSVLVMGVLLVILVVLFVAERGRLFQRGLSSSQEVSKQEKPQSSLGPVFFDPVDSEMSFETYLKKTKELQSQRPNKDKEEGGLYVTQALKSGQVFSLTFPLFPTTKQLIFDEGGTEGAEYLSSDFDLIVRHVISENQAEFICQFFLNIKETENIKDVQTLNLKNGSAIYWREQFPNKKEGIQFIQCIVESPSKAWILNGPMSLEKFEEYRNGKLQAILDSFSFTK